MQRSTEGGRAPQTDGPTDGAANGAALAAFLAAGIGSLAMGLVVVLNESGLFAAPALYAPAGGVSGRTTIAAAVWLAAWVVLHRRWRGRAIAARGVGAATLALVAVGIVLCLPPVWALL